MLLLTLWPPGRKGDTGTGGDSPADSLQPTAGSENQKAEFGTRNSECYDKANPSKSCL